MSEFIKKTGIPPYMQVEEYIRNMIMNREIAPGDKLPPEREMAEKLEVSRNTVSSAYRLLEKEGLVESMQGKGTFIKINLPMPTSSRKENLISGIDSLIDKAISLGFSLEQFLSFVNLKAMEYSQNENKLSLIVIDCNEEHSVYFAGHFQKFHFLQIHTILLDELPKLRDSSLVRGADLIVTTVKHYEDVKNLVSNKNIISIAAIPNLESLVNISGAVRVKKTGLICSGRRFYEIFLETMEKAGIPVNNIFLYNKKDNLKDFINKYDSLIVTPLFEKAVRSLLIMGDEKTVINFYFEIDKGSISAMENKILELKKQKRETKGE